MATDHGDGFEHCRKPTKRDAFLATTGQIVSWQALRRFVGIDLGS